MIRNHAAAIVVSLLMSPHVGICQPRPAVSNAGTSVVVVDPVCKAPMADGSGGGCSDFPPVTCQQNLDSYADMLKQPLSEDPGSLTPEVRGSIQKELDSKDDCETKDTTIQTILNTYWATDPWCLADRKILLAWIKGDDFKKVPDYAQKTISDALDDTIACRDGTTAVSLLLPRYGVTSPLWGPAASADAGAKQFKGRDNEVALMAKRVQRAERKAARAMKKCSGRRKK